MPVNICLAIKYIDLSIEGTRKSIYSGGGTVVWNLKVVVPYFFSSEKVLSLEAQKNSFQLLLFLKA